jgi:hypothetical protein
MAKAHVIESLIPSYFALDYVTVSLEWPNQHTIHWRLVIIVHLLGSWWV